MYYFLTYLREISAPIKRPARRKSESETRLDSKVCRKKFIINMEVNIPPITEEILRRLQKIQIIIRRKNMVPKIPHSTIC